MLLPTFAPAVVAGLVSILWLMLMAQAWQQSRSRRQLQRDLARIFEQLDLLALGAPVAVAAYAEVDAHPQRRDSSVTRANANARVLRNVSRQDDSDAVSELIARGASERELTTRCGIAPAEARILIAMRSASGDAGTLQ